VENLHQGSIFLQWDQVVTVFDDEIRDTIAKELSRGKKYYSQDSCLVRTHIEDTEWDELNRRLFERDTGKV
jgi:hypothetical protein